MSTANTTTKKYHANAANDFCTAFNKMATPLAHTASPTTAQAHANLRHIYRILHFLDDLSNNDSHSSGWDSNDDEEYTALWPSPPTTLIEEDDMHPLQLTVCGLHPSQGWRINSIGTTHYYRILVHNPSSNKNIVAPFISYMINQSRPTISGMYGQGYPIKMHPLTATGVNYATETITAKQQTLFYSNAAFASTIDHVLDNFCPFDLITAIC